MSDRRDAELFEQAMRGVSRLDSDVERIRDRRRAQSTGPTAITFEVSTWDEHHEGRATGADLLDLRRLEMGDFPPQLEVDLHGVGEEEARTLVRDTLRRALRGGLRSVRIVHGRGLRSAGGPILKRSLPRWLAEPPHGDGFSLSPRAVPMAPGAGPRSCCWPRATRRAETT